MEHITEGMAGEQERLIIAEEQAGQRADVGLALLLDITRSNMQRLLEDGRAVKGAKVLKANYKLKAGDAIIVTLPEPQPLDAQPENIPLDILKRLSEKYNIPLKTLVNTYVAGVMNEIEDQ